MKTKIISNSPKKTNRGGSKKKLIVILIILVKKITPFEIVKYKNQLKSSTHALIMSYRTIADPYNSRLQQVEESLNRSRRNLAQQQQYGSTTPASPYYTNSMANVGNVYHNTTDARNNMTSQLVADVRQLEQQRSLLLEEARRRNYDQAGMHRARTQQLQHATRYETDLRAEQVLQRQRESQMRSHVYNTLSTLPTTYAAVETS